MGVWSAKCFILSIVLTIWKKLLCPTYIIVCFIGTKTSNPVNSKLEFAYLWFEVFCIIFLGEVKVPCNNGSFNTH